MGGRRELGLSRSPSPHKGTETASFKPLRLYVLRWMMPEL